MSDLTLWLILISLALLYIGCRVFGPSYIAWLGRRRKLREEQAKQEEAERAEAAWQRRECQLEYPSRLLTDEECDRRGMPHGSRAFTFPRAAPRPKRVIDVSEAAGSEHEVAEHVKRYRGRHHRRSDAA